METFIDCVREDKLKLQNSISNWLNRVDMNNDGDQPEAGWEGIDEDEEEEEDSDGDEDAARVEDGDDQSQPGWEGSEDEDLRSI